jgi:hypothetical protein
MVTAVRIAEPAESQSVDVTTPDAQRLEPATALDLFLRAQVVNASQHAAALRPFRPGEFGDGPEAPSASHIQAANTLISRMREALHGSSRIIARSARMATASSTTDNLHQLLMEKDRAGDRVKSVERVWQFYFELFGQRQSRYGGWLLGADRIAIGCYQAVYTGLGKAQPVPSPLPFTYMETGFTPATYRRGVPLSRLLQQANPFPIVQIPFHRLINPWTLGAVHHEVSHNLQNDLGLWDEVPRRIGRRLRQEGFDDNVASLWSAWNKEIWADLSALLLGGPAIVASLIDVVGISPERGLAFNPSGVHPTPYLRTLINLELLRRMGFTDLAGKFLDLWQRLYPATSGTTLPAWLLDSFDEAHRIVVDEICYTPYSKLGNKSLAEVVSFTSTHDEMTREAAGRLAGGDDPGVIPTRFLVGAVRSALDRQLATPVALTQAFYDALSRR